MEKHNFKALIDKAKSNNTSKTIQKVIPVKEKNLEEIQFSFYLDKSLLKKIKLHALNTDQSIKNIINLALDSYLKQQ